MAVTDKVVTRNNNQGVQPSSRSEVKNPTGATGAKGAADARGGDA
jgi:hypothetical protein